MDGFAVCLFQDIPVNPGLLVRIREGRPDHERNFGAKQPDAVRPGLGKPLHIRQHAAIDVERDRYAVPRHGLEPAHRRVQAAALIAGHQRIGHHRLNFFGRPDEYLAVIAVDDHRVAGIDAFHQSVDLADDGNPESPGDDRNMRRRGAFFGDECTQPRRVVIQQFCGPRVPGNQDDVVGQILLTHAAPEMEHQADRDIFEVAETFPQIGIADAAHARHGVFADLLHGRIRCQAAVDAFANPAQPAAILCKTAIGIEHFAVFPRRPQPRRRQQFVNRRMHRRHRIAQTFVFDLGIVGKHLAYGDVGRMQNGFADGETVIDRHAGQPGRPERPAAAEFELFVRVDQIPGCDELRDDHGNDLKRFFFLFRIGALVPVLDHQHPADPAAANNGDSHQRREHLFAGLRAIAEIRVGLGVGQVQRFGSQGDRADQPLTELQTCDMDRFRIQSLGREKLENIAGPLHIYRADLCGHFRGHDADDLIEPVLRRPRPRHDIAETA